MEILGVVWITNRTTIGFVHAKNEVGEESVYVSSVDGHNEEGDKQAVADWGSRLSFQQAKGFFPNINEDNYRK